MPKKKHLALFIVNESTYSTFYLFLLILLLKCRKKVKKRESDEAIAVEKCQCHVTC